MARQSLWFRGGGNPHRGWYKHIWCDSSWELAVVLYCLDNGIEIVRCTEDFKYPFRNGFKYYRPDFIIDGVYHEIKGVMDNRSKTKIKNFPLPIKVIGKKEITPYIEYAQMKYGVDYWKLLENP